MVRALSSQDNFGWLWRFLCYSRARVICFAIDIDIAYVFVFIYFVHSIQRRLALLVGERFCFVDWKQYDEIIIFRCKPNWIVCIWCVGFSMMPFFFHFFSSAAFVTNSAPFLFAVCRLTIFFNTKPRHLT